MSQEPLVRDAQVAAFRAAVVAKLTYAVGKDPEHAFDHDWFEAIALAARDHMVEHWMDSTRQIYRKDQKRVYYLSLEFLIGRLLYDSLSNLGLLEVARLNGYLHAIVAFEPKPDSAWLQLTFRFVDQDADKMNYLSRLIAHGTAQKHFVPGA